MALKITSTINIATKIIYTSQVARLRNLQVRTTEKRPEYQLFSPCSMRVPPRATCFACVNFIFIFNYIWAKLSRDPLDRFSPYVHNMVGIWS